MAEFSSLPLTIQQKRTAEKRAPVKPEEPERPTLTISAKERLARQYDKSMFRSTRQAAENVRKGKGGKKSVQEQLKELLEEEGEVGGDTKEKTGSGEEKPKA